MTDKPKKKRISVRTKGQTGEREACKMLNEVIVRVASQISDFTLEDIERASNMVQRNQNQTAVGGDDLVNTMGLSFEVKRQEALSINTWWKQCVKSAERNGNYPVLMYRQNGKPWTFVTYGEIPLSNDWHSPAEQCVVSLTKDQFLKWFESWTLNYFMAGGKILS